MAETCHPFTRVRIPAEPVVISGVHTKLAVKRCLCSVGAVALSAPGLLSVVLSGTGTKIAFGPPISVVVSEYVYEARRSNPCHARCRTSSEPARYHEDPSLF